VPKKVKKTRVRVHVNGNDIIQSFDGESLKGSYMEWKNEQRNVDEAKLFVKNSTNILEMLSKHGVEGRGGVGNATDNTGAGSIIGIMDKILLGDDLIFEKEAVELLDVKKDLMYTEKNNNPKDIPFRVPIKDSYNKQLGKWEWETVHGHYRTEGYIQKRTLPANQGGDEAEETLGAAPKSYFNGQPPMWKALFGPGGLKEMTFDLLDNLKSMEVSVPMLNVRDAGAAQAIIKVDLVRRKIEDRLLGEEYRKSDGTYNAGKAMKALQTIPFKGGKDDDLVKLAAGIADIEGDIVAYKLNVTPLMMKKMALALGFQEKPVSESRTEIKEDIGKSWQSLLKGKKCNNCGSPMKKETGGTRRIKGKWSCPECSSKFRHWRN